MFISLISEYQISNVQCLEYPISNQLYVLNVQCFECPISNQLNGAWKINITTSVKNPKPPESKHKKTSRQKNRKTWFDERFGCAWPSKKLPRGDHAEVTPSPLRWGDVL